MPIVKDERLQIRVEPAAKRRLEEAAEAAHLSVSAFVLQAAEQRADELLLERQLIRLSPAAAEAFEDALSRPPMFNEQLGRALLRPPEFRWLGEGAESSTG
ncbi:MAG TPA: DUF1778 domain-containing protein [Chloroflexota bacterium]|nr:DUF1778 domain-containing protein [Chloroflexota bacterium]